MTEKIKEINKNEVSEWTDNCPVYRLFDMLGKKWTIFILILVKNGCSNFSSLQKKLPQINSKILSERLDFLIDKKYIQRNVTTEKPLKITYTVTQNGLELAEKIEEIGKWIQSKNKY